MALRSRAPLSLALATVGMMSCGSPKSVEEDTGPIEGKELTIVRHGWASVDTVALGIRAVLEIELESGDAEIRTSDLGLMALRFDSATPVTAARMWLGEPMCKKIPAQKHRCPRSDEKSKCGPEHSQAEAICRYTLRAQFLLDELPSASDLAVLLIGGNIRQR